MRKELGRAKPTPLTAALLATGLAVAGCGREDAVDPVPFWEADTETDSTSDTGIPPEDEDCPEDFVDDAGRCIRYVRFDAETPECGFTWNTAFAEIQPAIESAYSAALVHGTCEVWVAEGTYRIYDGSPLDSLRLRPGVALYGGFAGYETTLVERDPAAHATVLEGAQEDGPAAVYHVVMGANNASLDGFTVRGGRAVGDPPHHRGGGIYMNGTATRVIGCTIEDNVALDGGGAFLYDLTPVFHETAFTGNRAERGGGLYMINGFPQLLDVRFEDNRASADGGAFYAEQHYAGCVPSLIDVELRGNEADGEGGALYSDGCEIVAENAAFAENRAGSNGGAISAYQGRVEITDAVLEGNVAGGDGGALHVQYAKTELLRARVAGNTCARDGGGLFALTTYGSVAESRLTANRAGRNGGGASYSLDEPVIVSSVLAGNTAERGGGLYNGARSVPRVINTVFNGNRAFGDGAGVYNAELAEPEIVNTILYGDLGKEIASEWGAIAHVRYCDVMGGYPGLHNIDADPQFLMPGWWDDAGTEQTPFDDVWHDGDYHLAASSPCIDYADEDPSPNKDADGNPWHDVEGAGIPDIAVDMGAYDYQP